MRKKKNLPTAQDTSFDVSWPFFRLIHLRRHCRCLAVLELHPYPPCEQLLMAVVLGAGVLAVSVVAVVLRQWHRYNIDKTYH